MVTRWPSRSTRKRRSSSCTTWSGAGLPPPRSRNGCRSSPPEAPGPAAGRPGLLAAQVRGAVAENVLLDLPGGGLRQLGDERDPARGLEVSQPLAGERDDLVLRRGLAVPQHDEGLRGLPPALVGQAHDRGLLDCRVAQ